MIKESLSVIIIMTVIIDQSHILWVGTRNDVICE